MKTQLRIISGSLKGRVLTCNVSKELRPTPHRVRESLFSILGNAIPERPFFDVFSGTGIVGLEALSRGASATTFVERDFKLLSEIEQHLKQFSLERKARVVRADVYRWIERWKVPQEPVTVFLSPPFVDLQHRSDEMLELVTDLQAKLFPNSVLVLQLEKAPLLEKLPQREMWDARHYGRNHLWFWVQPESNETSEADTAPCPES